MPAARRGLTATITTSGTSGSASSDGKHGWPCNSSYRGFTKWQRVALPVVRRLSRTVWAIQLRGDAPTTATEAGANSGRRSMVLPVRGSAVIA